MKIKDLNWQTIESDVIETFLEHNIDEHSNPELTRQLAEISARISLIAIKKVMDQIE